MASGVSEESIAWESLGQQDVAAVGAATCMVVAVVVLLLHVLANRKWPPYRASIPTLLACTAFTVSTLLFCTIILWYKKKYYEFVFLCVDGFCVRVQPGALFVRTFQTVYTQVVCIICIYYTADYLNCLWLYN